MPAPRPRAADWRRTGQGTPETARRALVVESGDAPHMLAAVRGLSRAGWDVGLAVASGVPTLSRAVRRHYVVPAPEQAPDEFVAAVARIVAEGGYDVVFGADDIEVLLLSERRAAIPCVMPYGDHEDVKRSIDKLELTRAGARAGLHVPLTEPATPARISELRGPIMVKARWHWDPASTRGTGRHLLAAMCPTPAEAARQASAVEASGGESLLQEMLDGELMAVTVVRGRDGELLAAVQQRSPRLSMRSTSCRAETVPIDASLLERVERLLADLRWCGLANLQFIRPPDGEPHLIDLNGRFYGSLALAIASGVNLADVWGRSALGERVEPSRPARVGVRFQSLLEDLGRARVERRGGLVRDVAGSLAYMPTAVHPHADWRDPMPAVRLLRQRLARR